MFSHFFGRRSFLKATSCGFGYLAFAGLASESHRLACASNDGPLAPKPPHHPARAKRVILMFMQGGPSHVDTFDYRPKLAQHHGEPSPGRGKARKLLKSPFEFSQHGSNGLYISELFPELAKQADHLTIINSMHTDIPNHPQAAIQMHTGNFQFVRPSMGAWVLYGLGSENQELPGFITINPLARIGGAQNYGSAFLPAAYQGTKIGGEGQQLAAARIANISNPRLAEEGQRRQLEFLQAQNRERLENDVVNSALEGVIESYELAFRMQGAIPRIMDISDESQATKSLYGIGERATENFGRQCLLARRFAEAGVRFIELSTQGWDQHKDLKNQLTQNCLGIDRPIAALIQDLHQRDMLKDTLLVWGGEFGRTPGAQNDNGRDHNATGFSLWMAGGGVKSGFKYGSTDDFGVEAVENKVHIHDLHATILHLLGLNHEKLTFRYSGRDFRLTDVHGHVVREIMA